jgi:hypothetical protein
VAQQWSCAVPVPAMPNPSDKDTAFIQHHSCGYACLCGTVMAMCCAGAGHGRVVGYAQFVR